MSDKDFFDPSLNILRRPNKNIDAFFKPKTVALIGATEKENSVGKTLLWNLLRSPFGGTVYPINPKRANVLGIKAYKSVLDVEEDIDLAIIVTPSKFVPAIMEECGRKKVKAVVVISAGFKEIGEEGIKLEESLLEIARKYGIRVIGPNCLGVMSPISGLNATFAADIGLRGNVAFISQSGALCTAVLDWSFEANVGFSSFVSIGSMADIGWGDLIQYFGHDPDTKSILIYMESIGDSRAFLSAAREVALTKPIILIKAGRTEESALAAASHTGSLSGSDDVLDAALKRVGVLRVDTISDLFSMAEILSKQPLPKGPRLSIITNAGGPGVIATDALINSGGKLAKLSPPITEELNKFLPPQWSHNNPIDILGDASPELYAQTIEVVKNDEDSDGVLVILTPQDMTDPTRIAEKLIDYSKIGKPILASWMGYRSVKKGSDILNQRDIPTFPFPDVACKAFAYMFNYNFNLKGIYETPALLVDVDETTVKDRKEKVEVILSKVRGDNRTLLDEYESKKILEAYGLPVVATEIATTKEEAVTVAEKMGFPVVLKLYSKTITHKSDVGGVLLNLKNKEAVESAFESIKSSVTSIEGEEHFQGVTVQEMISLSGYEVILGSSLDPQFGPVLLFGMGGKLVEVFKDRSLGIPPLNANLAKRMINTTKIYEILKGVRGEKGCDLEQVERILILFSNLIVEQPQIKELDINPLLVSPEGIIALDARVLLTENPEEEVKLAIRPYPIEYVEHWQLKDQTKVVIRPIRPEDQPEVFNFHKELSEKTVLQRYLKIVHYDTRVASARLSRICFNDYDREIALVVQDPKSQQILAISRLTKKSDQTAVYSMTIRDVWQGKGIGTKLMEKMIFIAKNEHITLLTAEMLVENVEMQGLLKKFNFSLSPAENNRITGSLKID